MEKKTTIILIACLLVPMILYFSCFNPKTELIVEKDNIETSREKYRIGLVLNTSTNPFYAKIEEGARLAEVALNIELIVRTGTKESSVTQQIDIINSMIEKKVDAIVISPVGPEIASTLKKVVDEDIYLIFINNYFSKDITEQYSLQDVPSIKTNNGKCAKDCAELLTSSLNEPVDALILQGRPNIQITLDRTSAALEHFNKNPFVKKTFIKNANWNIDDAFAITKEIFTYQKNIKVIFSENDMMTLGVLHYLDTFNVEDVKIISIDAIEPAKNIVSNKDFIATVDVNAEEIGFEGIRSAYLLCKGESNVNSKEISYRFVKSEDFNN